MWRFARGRTDSGAEADDITAEAFAPALRRRSEVPADGGQLWLFGVARNILANHRRSHDRRNRLYLRLTTVDPVPPAYEPAPPPDNEVWVAVDQPERRTMTEYYDFGQPVTITKPAGS